MSTEPGSSARVIHLCECGCGQPTKIATKSNKHNQQVKGQSLRFLSGHNGRKPLAERFWSKVNKNGPVPDHCPELGPCWLWTGFRNAKGYGQLNSGGHKGPPIFSHRYSWIIHFGSIPPETPFVLHHCDNPPCPNPAHLFLGTDADNLLDASAKGRLVRKLTREQRATIRARYVVESISQGKLAKEYRVSQTLVSRITRKAEHQPL